MPNHFSKDLFFIKHKVTCYWKHTSQFTQPQTHSLTLLGKPTFFNSIIFEMDEKPY